MHRLPTDVALSLGEFLENNEGILGVVTSLAGSLVLTDRRVVIVREGHGYRPQNGIRSWDISSDVGFRYGAPRGGMGLLVLGDGKAATSFFVNESDWTEAMRLVTMAHSIAYRSSANDQLALLAS
jgi:hypothetical protein